MFKKILLVLTGTGAVGVLTVYLLTIPMLRRFQSRIESRWMVLQLLMT